MKPLFLLSLALPLVACGGGGGDVTDAAPSDAGLGDLGVDASADAGADASTFPPCDVPAPIVGGTPVTDALAETPARCGMAPYAWLRDPSLGSVVSHMQTDRYVADGIVTLAMTAGLTLPTPPAHDVKVERIVYTTQDRGRLVQASMLLAYPSDLTARTDVPVLVFMHGTSGFTAGCGASTDMDYHVFSGLFASYGWVVATPDYLGLESAGTPYGMVHPYLIGEPTAIASLDAARAAVRRMAEVNGPICASPAKVAFFGGSQGGHAALWVDRLGPYYARELTLIGGVATVPPADLFAEAQRALTMVVDATENVIASAGAQAPWYGRPDVLPQVFVSPWDTTVPAALVANCSPGDVIGHTTALTDVFQPALLTAAASPSTLHDFAPFSCWMEENGLTTTSTTRIATTSASYGILWVLGSNDELVATPIERGSYDTLCAAGMPLQYLECLGAMHVDTTFWSVPEILDFLDARRNGVAFTPECTRPPASTCRGTPVTP